MSKIAIVGEYYNHEETQWGLPFQGANGKMLDELLESSGIRRADCFLTTVFRRGQGGNGMPPLYVGKSDHRRTPGLPPVTSGNYLSAEFTGDLARLYRELALVQPNIIIAMGQAASWALLHDPAISKIRGTVALSPLVNNTKVIPTHPTASIYADYELRHIAVADFLKAAREAASPELRRVPREIWLQPTLQDIETFFNLHVANAPRLAFDIETSPNPNQITCVGFAPTPALAISIPFVDPRKPRGNYWQRRDEELIAWAWVARYLATPAAKVAQNGMYDVQYLWAKYGIPVTNFSEDTMLLHHSLHPELPKSLAFLGSIYTNEVAWKNMRPKGPASLKKEE